MFNVMIRKVEDVIHGKDCSEKESKELIQFLYEEWMDAYKSSEELVEIRYVTEENLQRERM